MTKAAENAGAGGQRNQCMISPQRLETCAHSLWSPFSQSVVLHSQPVSCSWAARGIGAAQQRQGGQFVGTDDQRPRPYLPSALHASPFTLHPLPCPARLVTPHAFCQQCAAHLPPQPGASACNRHICHGPVALASSHLVGSSQLLALQRRASTRPRSQLPPLCRRVGAEPWPSSSGAAL